MLSLFKRKADPISDRARELESEIKKLEREIGKLSTRINDAPGSPRVRSTARPGQEQNIPSHEPVFEDVEFKNSSAGKGEGDSPAHFNELGVRKYDLAAAIKRWKAHFRRGDASNPKLINYLASGSVHGLRPLRYEKRVARYRFIAAACFLLLVLYGLCVAFFKL